MFDKKSIKYIVILCVCLALDITALVLSFCLPSIFHTLTAGKCTQYEAVIDVDDHPAASKGDTIVLPLRDAKIWVDEKEKEGTEEQTKPAAGVKCTLVLEKEDIVEGEETRLSKDVKITFLSQEKEIEEGEEVFAVALKVRISENSEEDVNVATLDLHNREKNTKIKYTQIGLLVGVLTFFAGGGFCFLKLCGIHSKKVSW